MIKIYYLEENGKIFYVGKTNVPLNNRLYEHRHSKQRKCSIHLLDEVPDNEPVIEPVIKLAVTYVNEAVAIEIKKTQKSMDFLSKNYPCLAVLPENLILDDPENYLIFNTYGKDIEKLRSKILIYKKEIGKIENLINSLQIEGHTQDENY
jgi:hypothetical protein